MNIKGVHVEVYISDTPSDGSMQRVIENLLAAYEKNSEISQTNVWNTKKEVYK